MKKVLIALLLILSVIAVGCNRQMTEEEADAAFCQNLQAFDDSLANLEAISATSTVGELKDAAAEVEKAWNTVTKSANQLNNVKLDTIDEAWKNLRRTVNQVNSDDTVAAAVINVGVSVKEIRLAYAQIGDVSCPGLVMDSSAQPPAGDAQPADAATAAPEAPAVASETPVAPGFTGTYSATVTLAGSTDTALVLVLNEDQSVFMVMRPTNAMTETIVTGQWQDNGDETVTVTLLELTTGEKLATPEVLAFKLTGEGLDAVQYDEMVYGKDGFSLPRENDTSVAAETNTLQASAEITTTAPISDSAPITAGAPLTASAPVIVIPPATPAESAAAPEDSSAAAEQTAPASPLDRPWQLQQITQTSGVEYTPTDPSLYIVTFNAGGTLSVTADCNTGLGVYQADASGALTIDLASSYAYCAPGSLSNQFISYLNVANAYTVTGDTLGINFSSNSGLMTFTAAP